MTDVDHAATAAATTGAELASVSCHTASRSRTQPVTLADEVVRLGMLDQPSLGGIEQTHHPDAVVRVERVRADSEGRLHAVLQQPVDDDDVATHQFLATRHPLPGDDSVVDDELEIESRDEGAGIAVALRGLADVAQAPTEGEIAVFDGVLEGRAVDGVGDEVGKGSVALELRESEGRPERPDDRVRQVSQDVLCMVQLDTGDIARVPADIGEHEAGGFWFVGHHGSPWHWTIQGEDTL